MATFERAAEILRIYAKQDLEGGFDRNLLANVYTNLGILYGNNGRLAARRDAMDRMIAVRESLVKLSPGVSTFQDNLGHGLNQLGWLHEEFRTLAVHPRAATRLPTE